MQQTPTAAPAAPAAPPSPTPYVIQVGPTGVPQTAEQLYSLREKRSQLSDQLVSAASRRKDLAEQLLSAAPAARPGIEARLKVLDDRIVRLEQEIDRTGDALANTPGELLMSTGTNPAEIVNRVSNDIVPIVAIICVFVLGPFAVAMSRFIWKRAGAQPPARPALADQAATQRLEQLQQAVDTIAIEVERISEGQRFVTRLLSERDRALPAGPAEPVRASSKAAAKSERG